MKLIEEYDEIIGKKINKGRTGLGTITKKNITPEVSQLEARIAEKIEFFETVVFGMVLFDDPKSIGYLKHADQLELDNTYRTAKQLSDLCWQEIQRRRGDER